MMAKLPGGYVRVSDDPFFTNFNLREIKHGHMHDFSLM